MDNDTVNEAPEDAWNRILATLATQTVEQLWEQLDGMADYRGGDPERNLTLGALVHTLAERDDAAKTAFEEWLAGPPGGGDSGHIVAWMQTARVAASPAISGP